MAWRISDRKTFIAGDRARATAQTLVDDADAPIDLSGQTVRWELWTPQYGERVLTAAADIVAATAGTVKHEFTADDATYLIANPGNYWERWVRIDASSREESFPTRGPIDVWFRERPGT